MMQIYREIRSCLYIITRTDILRNIGDINALYQSKNVSGITVGHDGSIYYYTRPQKPISDFDFAVALRRYKKYTQVTGQEKALEDLSHEYGFVFRKLSGDTQRLDCGQDYDKYVCDDRDTSEYVQMIREMSDEEFEHFGRQLKDKEKNQD